MGNMKLAENVQEALDESLLDTFRATDEMSNGMSAEQLKHLTAARHRVSVARVEDAIRRYVDTKIPG